MQNPFESGGEAHSGQIRASERRNKAVVPAAGSNRVLRAEIFRQDFEDGFIVVVQAADNLVVDLVGDVDQVKKAAKLLEMVPCRVG